MFEDEQLGQVAREPARPEVAAVRAERGEELLRDTDVRGQAAEPPVEPRRVKRRPVDGGPRLGRGPDVVAGDQVDVEPVDGPGDVRVFGVLLAPVGQDVVADGQSEPFELLARQVGRETDEQVDIAAAREPRVPGRRADAHDVTVDATVRERPSRALGQAVRDRLEALALGGVRANPVVDPLDHSLEIRHRGPRLACASIPGLGAAAPSGCRSRRGNEALNRATSLPPGGPK